jgi:NADPH2:quinone reductase
MRAIQFRCPGEPSANTLELVDAPVPSPASHQVLLEVAAVGINFADIVMGRGMYLGGPRHPFVAGFEVAGTIANLGAAVRGYHSGQRVAAITNGGAFAEFVVADAVSLIPIPEEATFDEGAAFSIAFFTAYHCLHTCGRLQAGEAVLIHAAAGGVGTAAVQLAKTMNVAIYATAGSAEKLRLVEQLGADICINYRTEDFEAVIKARTKGKGVNVILESVGGEVLEKSQKCLAPWGRLVVYGASGSQPGHVNSRDLLFHNKSIIGFHLGNTAATRPELGLHAATALVGRWQAGTIRPVVGKVFPLEQAAEAMQWIIGRQSMGKVILRPHGALIEANY